MDHIDYFEHGHLVASYPCYFHGSLDSLDVDVFVVLPHIPDRVNAKFLCEDLSAQSGYDCNLITLHQGEVVWCYKGTIDECNNSLFKTFSLHKDKYESDIECPVKHHVNRKCGLKLLRTIRGLLSTCSRTQYRIDIKEALKSDLLKVKLDALRKIDLTQITEFKGDTVDAYKFLAFQIAQTSLLIEFDYEIFTKEEACKSFPTLIKYIYRAVTDAEILQVFLTDFIDFVDNLMKQKVIVEKVIDGKNCLMINLQTHIDDFEIVDIKTEQLI